MSDRLEAAARQLRARGVLLKSASGGFAVNYRDGDPADDYWTDDINDALAHGLGLEAAPAPLPPLGPMGTGKGKLRARMYAHNRKIASKRRRAALLRDNVKREADAGFCRHGKATDQTCFACEAENNFSR